MMEHGEELLDEMQDLLQTREETLKRLADDMMCRGQAKQDDKVYLWNKLRASERGDKSALGRSLVNWS